MGDKDSKPLPKPVFVGLAPSGRAAPAGAPFKPGAGGDVGSPVVSCSARGPPTSPPATRIRASLFFDGTLNNRTNVLSGPSFNSGDSYKSGASNIAKLESEGLSTCGPDVEWHFTVYTEGAGTTNREGDDSEGYGLATRSTGIYAKVNRGIEQMIANIRAVAFRYHKIEYIHLDVFGFSRGAATARFCIWKCMQEAGLTLRERLVAEGFSVDSVVVKFAGLYDTVSSYGWNKNFSNDTAELHLDAISLAEKVVHLASAEEHRENFSLTNINSAGSKGREIFLPGVHSDVGGGYADIEHEVDWQLFDIDSAWLSDAEKAALERERSWLIQAGWYDAKELAPTGFLNRIDATRRDISNAYSRIPLALMAEFARANGVPIAVSLEPRHPVPSAPSDLATANSEIRAYIGRVSVSSVGDWFKNDPTKDADWHRRLRHRYLHFSSRYGGVGHDPNWSPGGEVNGRRMRRAYNG